MAELRYCKGYRICYTGILCDRSRIWHPSVAMLTQARNLSLQPLTSFP
jgi:hypothetical protein